MKYRSNVWQLHVRMCLIRQQNTRARIKTKSKKKKKYSRRFEERTERKNRSRRKKQKKEEARQKKQEFSISCRFHLNLTGRLRTLLDEGSDLGPMHPISPFVNFVLRKHRVERERERRSKKIRSRMYRKGSTGLHVFLFLFSRSLLLRQTHIPLSPAYHQSLLYSRD